MFAPMGGGAIRVGLNPALTNFNEEISAVITISTSRCNTEALFSKGLRNYNDHFLGMHPIA